MKTKPTRPHTILWADDDPDDRHIIREIVEAISDAHHIKEVTNGYEVLRYLRSIEDAAHFPCLVVLDINMPILTGTDTLACLKGDEKYKNLSFAVFTTSSSEQDRKTCERYGVPMLTKPSSFNGFRQAITELLQLCQIKEANRPEAN